MKNVFILFAILAVALPVALTSSTNHTKQTVTDLLTESEKLITPEVINFIEAVFVFRLRKPVSGVWFLDLKNGSGKSGVGLPRQKADTTMIFSNSDDFFEMFNGTLDPKHAYREGRMTIYGNTIKALKLEETLQKLHEARRNGEV